MYDLELKGSIANGYLYNKTGKRQEKVGVSKEMMGILCKNALFCF